MKREIKFRAWDGRQMFYHDWRDDDPVHDLWQFVIKLPSGCNLMQFTGLKDKNGKEIYEGDIIIQYPGFGCMFSPRKGVVNYRDASFWFDLTTIAFVLEDHDCSLEVIGNIYEHGHLLDNGE